VNIPKILRQMIEPADSPKSAPNQGGAATGSKAQAKQPEPAATAPSATAPAKVDGPGSAKAPISEIKPTNASTGEAKPASEKDAKAAPTPIRTDPPPAPKPAEWKNQPAADEWCPSILGTRFPELRHYAYDDSYSFERVLANSWRIAGATRRGRLHAHQGTHREDAMRFRAGANHTILCVADGAGSSKFSRLGSHVAVAKMTDSLAHQLAHLDASIENAPEQLIAVMKGHFAGAVASACLALQELALSAGASPKDFRCTLLTVLRYHSKSRELLLTNQIGDGAICVLYNDKSIRRCGASDSGEFSGEVSCFVPDDCARQKAAEVEVIPNPEQIEGVLLCSDGIEDPFYPMNKNALEIFRQFHAGVKEKLADFNHQPTQPPMLSQDSLGGALAQWLGFEKRGENDDRSLMLLHRYPPTVSF
jgi:serine/threonine protein phosphatase PrpC